MVRMSRARPGMLCRAPSPYAVAPNRVRVVSMDVFDFGSRSLARERLNSFFEKMDEIGESYGYASGESDDDPIEITPDAPFIDLPDDDAAHAILLVEGTAEVGGGEEEAVQLRPGQGVLWQPGEAWSLIALGLPITFFQVESPALTLDHLRA